MKILAPFSKSNEVEDLIAAGANELYCGLFTDKWKKKYSNVACGNLVEFERGNLKTIDELQKSVKIAKANNVPVFLTLNSWYYTKGQISIINKEIKSYKEIGVDALIIADISLLQHLKKDIDIHLSTISGVFNKKSLSFFKKLGIKRLTLPEHITLKEISKLSNCGMVLECFILNSICKNVCSFCSYLHGIDQIYSTNKFIQKFLTHETREKLYRKFPESLKNIVHKSNLANRSLNPCFLRYNIKELNNLKHNLKINKYVNKNCGLCEIGFLENNNINHIKIVGRQYSKERKVNDVLLVKDFIKNKRNKVDNCNYECYW